MKFLAAFILVVCVAVCAYSGLAFVINPRGDFSTTYFPNLIANPLKEKMHLFRLYQAAHPVEGLLLGSSRSMKLKPATFDRAYDKRFFNFALNNAHVEEMLLVYDYVRQQGAHPKIVVFGLDVEALHNNNISMLTHSQSLKLRNQVDAKASAPPWWRQADETIKTMNSTLTVSYAQDMIRSIEVKANPGIMLRGTQLLDADGYQHYPGFEAQRRAGTFDLEKGIQYVQEFFVERFKYMSELSPQRKADLEKLIQEVRQDGGQIVIWITPIHPRVLALLNRKTPYPERLQEIRAYLQELHTRFGVTVYDCSDITRFGGTDTDWYDGAHVDEKNADRIMKVLLEHR
jgi:hypothetical protein